MSWDENEPAGRPLWLLTLADLMLLLVGFFVFLQANQRIDAGALAEGFRNGFGVHPVQQPAPMPVDIAVVDGFVAGSARPFDATQALAWAQGAARDPRTRLRIVGEVDGSAMDVDPVTGSGPILAADRARAIAAELIRAGAVSPDRIEIATGSGHRRALLTLGYDGGRQ